MRTTTLGELVDEAGGIVQTGPFGSQLHAHDYSNSGVAVVMPQNIRNGRLDHSSIAHVTTGRASGLSRHTLQAGDIVYSRRGDVEKCALVLEPDLPAMCGTGSLLVRVPKSHFADSTFLAYLLQTDEVRKWVRGHAVGATMLNLNTQILREVPLVLPPLPEQQAIADVLGALDDKIAANRALVATSLELVGAHHRHIKSGGVCTRTAFTDVAEIGGGATPSTKVDAYWEGDNPWAAPSDITALPAPYLEDTPRKITKAGLTACSSPLYPVGSILMTSRATIGAFAIAQVPTAVNQGFIVVQPHDPTLRWWLLAEMQQRVPEFVAMANGATFLELPRKAFRKMSFALPENAALQHFDSLAGPLHATSSSALRESSTLAALRDTLLPALMNGTLRVKDAERTVSEAL